jgi:hypothetical protein
VPEKLDVRLRFGERKPTMINVNRDSAFNQCFEEIRRRLPGMTLGDSWALHSRGIPKSMDEDIVGWKNREEKIPDLVLPDARLFMKHQ